MLLSQQRNLVQKPNQGLIESRQRELDYNSSIMTDFGMISALISGFTLSLFVGFDVTSYATSNDALDYIYWILVCITMCSSLQCLLTTMTINICSQNLAIRGPPG